MIEEYRKTLAALHSLEEQKVREHAPSKELRIIRAEMEEVAEVLRHLTKGVSRYKWSLP